MLTSGWYEDGQRWNSIERREYIVHATLGRL